MSWFGTLLTGLRKDGKAVVAQRDTHVPEVEKVEVVQVEVQFDQKAPAQTVQVLAVDQATWDRYDKHYVCRVLWDPDEYRK